MLTSLFKRTRSLNRIPTPGQRHYSVSHDHRMVAHAGDKPTHLHPGFPTAKTHQHLFTNSEYKVADHCAPGISRQEFKSRRNRLLFGSGAASESFVPEDNAIVIQMGYRVRYTSDHVFYPFHQNSNFHYLCGVNEPNCALILLKKTEPQPLQQEQYQQQQKPPRASSRSILFCKQQSQQDLLWDGRSLTPRDAVEYFGVDEAHSLDRFSAVLTEALSNLGPGVPVYIDLPVPCYSYTGSVDQEYSGWHDQDSTQHIFWPPIHAQHHYDDVSEAKQQQPRYCHKHPWTDLLRLLHRYKANAKQLQPIMHRVRLLKSHSELELMRKTAKISCEGFIAVLNQLKSLRTEHQVWALFEYECRRRGADKLAYVPVIAGSGDNACVIHYTRNDMELKTGDLLLMDAGAYFRGYVADITRTVPINGRYSQAQKQIYDCLQTIQRELIQECRQSNGMSLDELYRMSMQLVIERICVGIFGLNAFMGDAAQLAKQIYPHHIGHWLGMDVHDCPKASNGYLDCSTLQTSDQAPHRKMRWWANGRFEEGMVVTVEPGIYIPSKQAIEAQDGGSAGNMLLSLVPDRYRGIGIRIEDDVFITGSGEPEILTRWLPTDSDWLERQINCATF